MFTGQRSIKGWCTICNLYGCSYSEHVFESNTNCYYSMKYWRNWWHKYAPSRIWTQDLSDSIPYLNLGYHCLRPFSHHGRISVWNFYVYKLYNFWDCMGSQNTFSCQVFSEQFWSAKGLLRKTVWRCFRNAPSSKFNDIT